MATVSPLQMRVIPPELFDRIVGDELLERMRKVLVAQGRVVVTLPFGQTPVGIYEHWLERQPPFDWRAVVLVNGDEYLGEGHEDSSSASRFLRQRLLQPLIEHGPLATRLRQEHVRLLDGTADPVREAAAHERFIAEQGGIDIALVGIGTGPGWSRYRRYRWLLGYPGGDRCAALLTARQSSIHLWFNERGSRFDSRTRVVELAPETRRINGVSHGAALSLGLANTTDARQIVVVAKGEAKRSAVDLLLRGPISERIPASVLRRPGISSRVTLFVDTKASP